MPSRASCLCAFCPQSCFPRFFPRAFPAHVPAAVGQSCFQLSIAEPDQCNGSSVRTHVLSHTEASRLVCRLCCGNSLSCALTSTPLSFACSPASATPTTRTPQSPSSFSRLLIPPKSPFARPSGAPCLPHPPQRSARQEAWQASKRTSSFGGFNPICLTRFCCTPPPMLLPSWDFNHNPVSFTLLQVYLLRTISLT